MKFISVLSINISNLYLFKRILIAFFGKKDEFIIDDFIKPIKNIRSK